MSQSITCTGISSGFSSSNHVMVGVVKPSSISTDSIVSSPKVNLQNLVPSSIASGEVHGSPTVIKQPRQIQSIAKIVKHRLPQYVQSDFPRFIDFLEKYYEWMEIRGNALGLSKDLPRLQDLDTTEDPFLHSLQKEVMSRFPKELYVDPANPNNRVKIQNAIKNIVQFYGAKGTERAYKYLFRLILGAEIDFYYPRVDMLRPSDGKWIQNYSVRVEMPTNSADTPFAFINKKIIGQNSQSSAFVEYAIKLEIGLNVVYELFLNRSSITGEFYPGEILYSDEAPNVFANPVTCVTGFKLFDKGSNYSIGTEIASNFQNFNIQDFKATVSTVSTLGNVTKVDIVSPGFKIPPSAFNEVKIGQRTYNNILVYEPDGDNELHIIPQVGTIIKYKGYFLNDDGKLSDAKFIQDSFYYQQFSYVVKVSESFDFYESFVKDLIHPSGLKLFGNFLSENFISSKAKVQNNLQITLHNEVEYNDISFKPLDVELKLEVDPNIEPELDEYQLESLVRYRNGASLNSIDRFKFTYKPNGGNDEDRLLYSGNSNYWKTDFANYQIKDFFDIIVGDFWMKPWLRTKIQPEPILKDPLCDTPSPFPSGSKQLFIINIHTQEIFGTPSILSGATSILTSSINSDEEFGSINIDLGLSPIVLSPEETLYTWGYIANGTLPRLQSTPINEDNLIPYSDVILKGELLMALKQDGQLWEDNIFAGLTFNRDSNFVKITGVQYVGGGNYGNAGIKDDGTLWQWPHYVWYEPSTHTAPTLLNADTDWVSLDSGINHFLALKSDGTLWSWGRNVEGQLGDGTTVDSITPIQVGTDTDWSFIAAGGYASFAIKNDGTLWQLTTSVLQIGIDTDWINVSTSSGHHLAIKSNGTLWAWGDNTTGQLGDGTTISKTEPIQIGTDDDWTEIATGFSYGGAYSYGIKSDKSLWGWGAGARLLSDSPSTDISTTPQRLTTYLKWNRIQTHAFQSGGILDVTSPKPIFCNTAHAGETFGTPIATPEETNLTPTNTLWGWHRDNFIKKVTGRSDVSYGVPVEQRDNTWSDFNLFGRMFSAIKSDQTNWAGRFDGSMDVLGSAWIKTSITNSGAPWNDGATIISIRNDGTLWSNTYNWQFWNGALNPSPNPTLFDSNIWTDIDAGVNHFLGLKSDGTLWAWGRNAEGQLGDGTNVDRLTPVQIGTDSNWSSIFAIHLRSFAIKIDGTLWAWGHNVSGQLGDGTTVDRTTPTQVGTDTDWKTVASGGWHTLGVKTNGTLWSWGTQYTGELGIGSITGTVLEPIQVGTETDWDDVAGAYVIFNNAAYSFALKVDGSLWAWGSDYRLPITSSFTEFVTTPEKITTYLTWNKIEANGWHVGALLDASSPEPIFCGGISTGEAFGSDVKIRYDGLYTWGSDQYGQLSNGSATGSVNTPTLIDSVTNWNHIAAGSNSLFGLKSDGTLWSCGYNVYGQLGLGDKIDRNLLTQIGTATNWTQLVVGWEHAAAIKDDGTLWIWGRAANGRLGLGLGLGASDVTSPSQVGSDTNWRKISLGYDHTLAIKTDGTLWAWGENGSGQIGNNSTTDVLSPIQIGTDTNWIDIECGLNHSLAIKSDGTLWAWGNNVYGQIGDGTVTQRNVPKQVGVDTTWKSIVAGYRCSHALKLDDTLWAWGDAQFGQLGNGSTTNGVSNRSPAQIGSDNDWKSISSNINNRTYALKKDGTLWVCGRDTTSNPMGFGVSQDLNVLTFTQIGTDQFWMTVSPGAGITAAIRRFT